MYFLLLAFIKGYLVNMCVACRVVAYMFVIVAYKKCLLRLLSTVSLGLAWSSFKELNSITQLTTTSNMKCSKPEDLHDTLLHNL